MTEEYLFYCIFIAYVKIQRKYYKFCLEAISIDPFYSYYKRILSINGTKNSLLLSILLREIKVKFYSIEYLKSNFSSM
jgi:hypothetical protein